MPFFKMLLILLVGWGAYAALIALGLPGLLAAVGAILILLGTAMLIKPWVY